MGGPHRNPDQELYPQEAQSHAVGAEPGQGARCRKCQYLLVEAQAQSKAPAVLLIPMLSAQQVLVEVWQGQAGPEVGAQHADRRQHNEGVGHGACGRAGGQSGATSARPGPWLPHPPLLKPTHLSRSGPSAFL